MSSGLILTVDSTLGAASIGFFVSSVIFGLVTSQVYTYFRRYPSDKPGYKILVAALWSLELVDQAFIGYTVYFYVVINFRNPLVLITGKVVWTLISQVVVASVVGCIVKICFAMRVWRFSNRNIYITGALLSIILTSFGFGIVYCVEGFLLANLLEADKVKTYATLALATGVAADILTAASLCFFLRRLRTGHKNSDTLINNLTIYAINTGALTSVVSVSTVILYNIYPDAFYFMATYFVLSKLYSVSFFCTLNTRKIRRGGRGTDRQNSDTSKSGGRSQSLLVVSHHRRTADLQSQTKSIEIGVAQEVTVSSDHIQQAFPTFPYPPPQNAAGVPQQNWPSN